jgi:hypothetical protein
VIESSKENAGLPPQVGVVADVPDQAEKAPPAADVIDEAEKAKREPDQPISAPDPVPAQPVLVMQGSKEHIDVPPPVVAKQPDAVPENAPSAPPVMDTAEIMRRLDEQIAEIRSRPNMRPSDRMQALRRVENQKALAKFDAQIRGQQGLH